MGRPGCLSSTEVPGNRFLAIPEIAAAEEPFEIRRAFARGNCSAKVKPIPARGRTRAAKSSFSPQPCCRQA